MRVLIFEPGYTPYTASFKDSEEAIAKVVRTESQMLLPFGNEVIGLVCSAQQENLPPNRTIEDSTVICGRFFVCGFDGEKIQGLTQKQADRYYRRFLYPEKFYGTGKTLVSEIQYPRIKPGDERIGKRSWARER